MIKSVIEMWKREAGVRLHVEKLVTIFKMNEMDVTDSKMLLILIIIFQIVETSSLSRSLGKLQLSGAVRV